MPALNLFIFAISIFLARSPYAIAEYGPGETETRNDYRKECLEISDFIKSSYNVQCRYNYHHFNSSAYREIYNRNNAIRNGKVRIAGFNVLHPGMSKTRYKDYGKIAQIIDKFDVVGATELLPLVSDDLRNNKKVVKFLKRAPKKIQNLRERIKNESNAKDLKVLAARLQSLEEDFKRAKDLYRMPGYLKILHALHQLDGGKQWALILSPRGEAANKTDVQELTGFYYRASVVKPKVNQYCRDIRTDGKGYPIACIPSMGRKMLGENKKDMFSRRPFMAEFISGKFSFAMLASHVVFSSPDETAKMRSILQKSFGVDRYEELGTGANAANYARFAEVKVTLDFMRELRERFNQEDIILVGDLNLESSNPFWDRVLPAYPGAKLFVTEKTTVSERRYEADGTPTMGFSSDYDHFIFDPEVTNECKNSNGQVEAKVYNFYEGIVAGAIKRSYKARKERTYAGRYVMDRAKYSRIERVHLGPYKDGSLSYETIGNKKVKVGRRNIRVQGIVRDHKKTAKYIDGFYERVLDSQAFEDSYYRYFSELVSDHHPIYMDCSTN